MGGERKPFTLLETAQMVAMQDREPDGSLRFPDETAAEREERIERVQENLGRILTLGAQVRLLANPNHE